MQEKRLDKSETMRLHVTQCKASGKKVGEYCKAHNLSEATYYYWHRKLIDEQIQSSSSFIQVQPLKQSGSIEIVFTNGVRIYFENVVAADYLKHLVS